ncbi:MAG: histidine phosphatase family protein [Candidatus Eisenbacteria bacterium]|uniref:Histidine phosphatase family protein n=1 Tax=Eiseniibacteriota bacterium TaxID=2212470 RepID=A0A933SBQ6_UNCEI|nr:histidine phosphatase family protein [Candidatus Eisenbacteria bacterium]
MKRLLVAALALVAFASFATGRSAAQPAGHPGAAAATKPAPPAAAAPAGKGMHYVYLIRHGIYDRDDKVDDRVGNGLNALGREQAGYIAERLAATPVKFRSLVSSTLLRAMQTADVMSGPMHMSVARDSLLSECTMTSSRADLMAGSTAQEFAECDAQVDAVWNKYFGATPGADTYDVLVCHGNVIRYLVSRAVGLDTREWARFDIGNCSLTVIQVLPNGGTRLAIYGDVGHIPLGRQTFSGKGGGWGAAK